MRWVVFRSSLLRYIRAFFLSLSWPASSPVNLYFDLQCLIGPFVLWTYLAWLPGVKYIFQTAQLANVHETKQNKRHTDSRSNERKIHCQKALFCELESFCRCFQHSGTNPVLFRYSDPVPGNGCHEQLDPCNPAILLRRTQLGKRTFWKPTDDANGVCVCARAWCSCCLFSMRRRVCSHVSVCGSHRDFVAQNIPRIWALFIASIPLRVGASVHRRRRRRNGQRLGGIGCYVTLWADDWLLAGFSSLRHFGHLSHNSIKVLRQY